MHTDELFMYTAKIGIQTSDVTKDVDAALTVAQELCTVELAEKRGVS